MNAIEINNLCKHYDGFTLDHLNLTLPGGCILGLIGENGAGKSTTIKLMMDMIHRDSGTITLLGKNTEDMDILTKEKIGVVMDEVGLPLCLTTDEIGKIMQLSYSSWDQTCYESLISQFSIPSGKQFRDFSKGMKMKTGIAVALSHHARLLILDEATSGLDPVVRDEVLDILNEFTRSDDHSVLISSHIVSDLEKLCDYIAFLHHGKLILCEEKDVLLARYGIVRMTQEQIEEIPETAILHKNDTGYGIQALVNRDSIPTGTEVSPVTIEELFVQLVKEMH
ncbi:MAG: ABC transporter ATP-binding protein [Bulleidia sp.]